MRRTAEGVHVVEWDGDWAGQVAGFFFVPGPDDRIAWFSFNGRLHARQG